MKKIYLGLFLSVIMAMASYGASSSLQVKRMYCENLVQPLGIDNVHPHFSWQTVSEMTGDRQTAYEIQMGTDVTALERGEADLWATGRVASADQVMVPYGGKSLQQRQLCYWRVRVWDANGQPSAWSETARFSVGLLGGVEGDYIGMDTKDGDVRAPLLRRQVQLAGGKTTFIHVNSLGYHELYVNGHKAGEQVLQPAVSQLDRHSLIVTYDVTPFVKDGQNDIVIWAGQGWYKAHTFGAQHQGPLVKAEIDQLLDGSWQVVAKTDRQWQASASGYGDTGSWYPLQFGGERMDGRQVPADLSSTTLDGRTWSPVEVVSVTGMTATPQMFGGNRIISRSTPLSVTRMPSPQPSGEMGVVSQSAATWLVDMGRVLTGWLELRIPGLERGQEVRMEYTDYIPLGGQFESQGESDVYIASGRSDEMFCNKFNHHAYRYVRISVMNDASGDEALARQGDLSTLNSQFSTLTSQFSNAPEAYGLQLTGTDDEVSAFACSDSDINAIHDMINYTMRCLTFSGYMVDCPHLERMGYGGDGNSSTMTLQTMYNVAPTFMNWLTAWGDVIDADGSLPYVAPAGGGGGGPYWSGFIIQAPWRTYLNYGDKRPLERLFDKMDLWLSYVDKYTKDGLLQPWPDTSNRMWFLGDWLAPDGVDVGGESPLLVNNCFVSECLGSMSAMAKVLGRDATKYDSRREALNKRIHEVFYHPATQTYGTGSPLDMSYPMLVGAVPASLYDTVKNQLVSRSRTTYKNHIAVGLVGVPVFTEWVVRNQASDLMLGLLKQPDYPGYLNMIANGATTTWEYWNGERSRVHNCYNGIGTWFYQALAGILPDAEQPGYRHCTIKPQRPQGMTWVEASKYTPYGKMSVRWDESAMFVELPVGMTATVYVPVAADAHVYDGDVLATQVEGVSSLGYEDGCHVLLIGSGRHRLSAVPVSGIQSLVQTRFAVHPNPTKGSLYWSSSSPVDKLLLYNTAGQNVMTSNILKATSGLFDMNRVATGTYLLTAVTASGRHTTRVVKN